MEKTLYNVLKNNLTVRKTEKVLVLTDMHANPTKKQRDINQIAEKTAEIAKKLSKNVFLLKYPAVGRHSGPLPKTVEAAMLDADVILCITWFSTSHTDARRKASKRGARIATTPTLEKRMLEKGGSVDVDYRVMEARCAKMQKRLRGKKQVRVLGAGTDLSFSIAGRRFEADNGLLSTKGAFSNLPAGEVYGAPVESSAEGILASHCPRARMEFKKGKVIKYEGRWWKREIMAFPHRRTIAELGIGVNPNAKDPDNGLEAEKIFGTIHIAVGDSKSMPGGKNKSDVHHDFVVFKPTLIVDGKTLIKKGKWVI